MPVESGSSGRFVESRHDLRAFFLALATVASVACTCNSAINGSYWFCPWTKIGAQWRPSRLTTALENVGPGADSSLHRHPLTDLQWIAMLHATGLIFLMIVLAVVADVTTPRIQADGSDLVSAALPP